MFGVGIQELIIIALLFLVVFGPEKLTRMAHELGKFVREARRSIEEFKAELTLEDDADSQRDFVNHDLVTPPSTLHAETSGNPQQRNRLR